LGSSKLGDFLRVVPAHNDPRKVPGTFADPMTDALCGTPKWLKSSMAKFREFTFYEVE
jgi:hypothetical protein